MASLAPQKNSPFAKYYLTFGQNKCEFSFPEGIQG
jgi:hypothetical protein